MQCITGQRGDQQQDLDTPWAARSMQVKGKAETQTLHVPKTFLNLHPLAVDTENFPSHPLRLRQIAGEQPGFLFTASVLSAEFAARDVTRHSPMFSPLGRLVNAVQRNAVRCATCHLNLCKRTCGRCCLPIELLYRSPLTLLVTIEITIAHTSHVIPAFGFDGLEPETTKPGIRQQDRYALLGKHKFKRIEQPPLLPGATFTIMHTLVNRERSASQRN
ncbi:hypothetical protein SAMN03159437_00399 [Pseudomonas sp. NFACC25]|nr:hypothetical protein FX984_01958 [Pseudomonas marginalis]PUB46044.1 hypothetical protein C8K58_104398 [Pseudomonas sp. GV047]SCX03977.1 hypothetical protein SAMN03159437_00399 [Pseudomonas sp. NFACC25]